MVATFGVMHASNPVRCDLTDCSKVLASMVNIVIDKMHMKGHTDKWCHDNCNPNLFKQLDKVSS